MKKIFKMSFVLMFVLTFIITNVSAATYATEGLVKQYVTEKKDTVEISIALQGPTAYINSVSLYIPYDSTKLVSIAESSNLIVNDGISHWATKQFSSAYSSYDGTNYIKINYASVETSGYDWFKANENQEIVLFSFQLQKVNANERIGVSCPTTWGAVKVSPVSYAYSTITTANSSADYSVKSAANPQLFTIVYTQYENIITASINKSGVVKIDGTFVTDGSSTIIDDGAATIEVIPDDGYEVESASFDGTDMNIANSGGTYEAVFTGTKALIVKFKCLYNKITPAITGLGIVMVNGVVLEKSNTGLGLMGIGSGNVYNPIILDDTGKATIKIVPGFDRQVSVATLDGLNIGISADGGFFEATIDGEAFLVVEFVTITTDPEKPQMYKYIFPESNVTFPGKAPKKAMNVFVKNPRNGMLLECGVKLTDSDGNNIYTPDGADPYYPAVSPATASGQFGVQFIALPKLEDGKSYIATAFIRKDTGEYIFGNSVAFTVE